MGDLEKQQHTYSPYVIIKPNQILWLSVSQNPLVGYCGRILWTHGILLLYPTMGICLTDSYTTWFAFYPMTCDFTEKKPN